MADQLQPLSSFRKRFIDMTGSEPAPSTIARWRDSGVRGHRLNCTRIGGRWYVSEANFAAFLSALNGGTVAPSNATKAQAKVDAALDALGV